MNPTLPLVSVVIPAHNEETSISSTLRSLQAQDYPGRYEIIVVDNNSTDQTAPIARSLGACVVRETRQGVAPARQRGFEAASGPIILTTDADTLFPHNWISRVVREFEKHPDAAAVAGAYYFYNGPLILRIVTGIFYEPLFRLSDCYSGVNLAVKKEAFQQVGGFNLSLAYSEDTDLGRRLKQAGKVVRTASPRVRTSARRYIKFGTVGGMAYYATRYIRTFHMPDSGPVSFEAFSSVPKKQFWLWKTMGRLVGSLFLFLFGVLFLSVDTAHARLTAFEDTTEGKLEAAHFTLKYYAPPLGKTGMKVFPDAPAFLELSLIFLSFEGLATLLLTLYAVAHPASRVFGRVIYRANTHQKALALTFDDGPNPTTTPAVLAILKEKGIKATFFVIGENARLYPHLLEDIDRDGHEIEVHSRTHSQRLLFSRRARIREELVETSAIIAGLTARHPRYFRPPWGRRTPWMIDEAAHAHLATVTWSIDTRDWLFSQGKKVIRRFDRKLAPGAIVLMHDGRGQSHVEMKATLNALPAIIAHAQNNGYSFMRLDDLLRLADQPAAAPFASRPRQKVTAWVTHLRNRFVA